MYDESGEFPLRPAAHADANSEGAIAMARSDEPEPLSMIVNPITRKGLPFWLPDSQSSAIIAVFDEIAAHHAAAALESTERRAITIERHVQRSAIFSAALGEASSIACNLQALASLFWRALDGEDDGEALRAAGQVVADCLVTMAARLAAIEETAHARASAEARP